MRLSDRLEAIVSLLKPGVCLGDVGTDHALVPVAAIERRIMREAIATDRYQAPLEQACARLKGRRPAGLRFRQGEGLLPLVEAACDALVIAGMGGRAIVGILSAAPRALCSCEQLIVAPNQEPWLIRQWALQNGWHLSREMVVYEGGRDYPILRLLPVSGADPAYAAGCADREWMCHIGPLLLTERSPDIRAYFERQLHRAKRRSGPDGMREYEIWRRALDGEWVVPVEEAKEYLNV